MTERRIDVAIVGARIAGSALAARLARAGLRVALFDRDPLPGPTLSTHILHSTGDLRIEGVYDELLARGVPELNEVQVRMDEIEIRLRHPHDPGMCARRDVLDQILLDRAEAAGAEVHLATPVLGLLGGGDSAVEGVRFSRPDGAVEELRAGLVVGADGRNSSVARWVGARQYLTSRSERALVWRYFKGRTIPSVLRWHRIGEHIVSILPTGPAEFVLITQPPERLQAPLFDPDPQALIRHVAGLSPEIGELASGAQPDGPPQRIVRYPCYFRQAYGPGWALIGDAGHAKDATLGHGINDALRHTRTLAELLIRHWSSGPLPEPALRRWARERDRAELATYFYGQDLGQARPITETERAILMTIQRNPRLLRKLDDVMGDRLAPDRLLTPGRLLAASLRRLAAGHRPGQVAGQAAELVRLDLRRRRAVARRDRLAPLPPLAAPATEAPVPVGGVR